MKSALILSILLIGCGGSSTATRTMDNEAGAGGEVSSSGGSVSDTGGTGGSETGGSETGGSSGAVIGGAGAGGEPETGGTGNVGGNCEPWDLDNIAIELSGWTPESGDPIPQACEMVQDPCTSQWIDAGECGEYQGCGTGNAQSDGWYDAEYVNPIPNICGESCVEDRTGQANFDCITVYNYRFAMVCAEDFTSPPSGCEDGTQINGTTWCCN